MCSLRIFLFSSFELASRETDCSSVDNLLRVLHAGLQKSSLLPSKERKNAADRHLSVFLCRENVDLLKNITHFKIHDKRGVSRRLSSSA